MKDQERLKKKVKKIKYVIKKERKKMSVGEKMNERRKRTILKETHERTRARKK